MKYYLLTGMLILSVFALLFVPQPVLAHDKPCIWNGSKNSDWFDPENWEQCEGVPQPHDDVEVSSGAFLPVIDSLKGDALIHNLDLQGGHIYIDVGRVLQVQGTLTLHGGAEIWNDGTVKGAVVVTQGTAHARGVFDGPITIDPLATLVVVQDSALVLNNELSIAIGGKLSTQDGGSVTFKGSTLTNNGTVDAVTIFSRAGAQTITGGGAWQGLSALRINGGSRTSLGSPITFQIPSLVVSAGATFSLATHTLVLGGTTQISIPPGGIMAGTGTLDTRGTLSINNSGIVSPTIQVTTGNMSSQGGGGYDGPISVAKGATLTVGAAQIMNINNNFTLQGTLQGGTPLFRGGTFTNNGQVWNPTFQFVGGNQTLKGTGIFSPTNTATIANGTTVILGSDHQMGKVTIYVHGKFDITGRTLSLSGAGTPLLNQGTFTTANSTVIYNGTAAQNVATANINYHSVTINNKSGVTLPNAEVIPGTLTLKEGTFNIGGSLGLGNGATISRENGSFNGTPNFGAEVNVEYTGVLGVTTGTEIPASPSVMKNLKVARVGGVTLGGDATMHGELDLALGDLNADGHTLTMTNSATSAGDGDVVGNTRRSGPFGLNTAYSFGNRFVTIKFTSGSTLPSAVTVNLTKDAPSDFTNAVKRKYTVTPANGSGYAATWRMHYQDGELNSNSEDTLQLFRYDDSAHRWVLHLRTGMNTSDNWIERDGVSKFSPWTLGSASCVAKPEAPTLVAPANRKTLAKSRVTLKWNAVNCADTYRVIVKQDSKNGPTVDRKKNVTETQYKTDTLPRGHTYFWRVQARNSSGSTWSVWRKFTLP